MRYDRDDQRSSLERGPSRTDRRQEVLGRISVERKGACASSSSAGRSRNRSGRGLSGRSCDLTDGIAGPSQPTRPLKLCPQRRAARLESGIVSQQLGYRNVPRPITSSSLLNHCDESQSSCAEDEHLLVYDPMTMELKWIVVAAIVIRRSHLTVSGFSRRSPIRTLPVYTEPVPCDLPRNCESA